MGKQIKVGAVINYITLFLSIISGILLTPFIVSKLGDSQYGLYTLISALVSYLTIFDMGFNITIVRFVSMFEAKKQEKEKETFLGYSRIIYIIIASLMLLASCIIYINFGQIFKNLTVDEIKMGKIMFSLVSSSLVFSTLLTPYKAYISSQEKFIFLRTVDLGTNILRILMLLLVVLIPNTNAIHLISVAVICSYLSTLLNLFYSIFKLKIKIKIHYWDKKLFKQTFAFAFFIFLQILIDQIYWKIDEIIIGIKLNTVMVAIYGIAMSLNTYVTNLDSVMPSFFLPKITKTNYENNSNEELTNIMIKVGRINLIIHSLITIGFLSFGKDFILLWLNESYLPAYYILSMILVSDLVQKTESSALTILRAKNKHKFTTTINFIVGLLNIVFTIYFINLWGIIGAAIATCGTVLLNTLVSTLYYQFKIKLEMKRFFIETYKGMILIIPIMLLFNYLLNFIGNLNWIILIFKGGIYVIAYAILIYILFMNNEEKDVVKKLLCKIGGRK